jgi:hypothetical protein
MEDSIPRLNPTQLLRLLWVTLDRGASMNRTAAVSILLIAFLIDLSAAKPRSTKTILRVHADKNSDVHMVLNNGKEALVPHQGDQTGIEDAKIAADGRTAGWLVSYLDPSSSPAYKFEDFQGALVIWRNGKIVRTFDTGPTYWSWAFAHGGDQVAYHSGPTHQGPSSHCELREVNTGQMLASWDGDLQSPNRPAWTKVLDH